MMSIVVLLSGSGSNLQAIIDNIANHHLPVKIEAVISNDPEAFGLERARKANIPVLLCEHTAYKKRAAFDMALLELIAPYQPDFIVLAGFMRVLSPYFVEQYPDKILNIHPSLLPAYRGMHTHARVLEAGEKEHGTSVHFVNSALDDGPIIAQAKCHIQSDDTEETLQQRVLKLEHQLYPLVLRWLDAKEITYNLEEGMVFCRGKPLPPSGLLVPFSINDED
jgi:phosphoribosylglycinamide formyltransferase-1